MRAIIVLSTGGGDQVESGLVMGSTLLESDLHQSANNSH
jgi:hypothetical protein